MPLNIVAKGTTKVAAENGAWQQLYSNLVAKLPDAPTVTQINTANAYRPSTTLYTGTVLAAQEAKSGMWVVRITIK